MKDKEWQEKYLFEEATTKDASTLAKLVQKYYGNKKAPDFPFPVRSKNNQIFIYLEIIA